MADVRSAWHDTGDRLAGLGSKLKLHYTQQRGDDESRTDVKEAAKRLAEAVQDGFGAVGSAARDSAVRADVKEVGQSLTGALSTTFSEVSDEVRKAFRRPEAESSEASPSATNSGAGAPAGPDEDPPRVEPWGTP